MELPKDIVSRLLANGGGRPFLVSALLLLDPEDLKACRLVCSAWNKFIEEEVWSSKSARSSLTKKLVYRWKNSEGSLTRGEVVNKGEVQSIVCNDSHVFLILKTGVVAVFCTIYLWG